MVSLIFFIYACWVQVCLPFLSLKIFRIVSKAVNFVTSKTQLTSVIFSIQKFLPGKNKVLGNFGHVNTRFI